MIRTRQSKTKRITLKDLFFFYPYKQNIRFSRNTVPSPYIRKEDVVDHEHSLDFNEWSFIVDTYLEVLKEELSKGNSIVLPQRLGWLQIRKKKMRRFFNRIKSTAENKVFTYRTDCDNYYLDLIWYRKSREAMITLKWYWGISPIRTFIRDIYRKCETDYTKIYNFIDK